MTSTPVRKRIAGRNLALMAIGVMIVGLGALAGTPEDESQLPAEVSLDDSDEILMELPPEARARVVLGDVREAQAVSPDAGKSMVAARTYRRPVAVRVPVGTVEGSQAWWEAPLVRVDAAQMNVLHIQAEPAVVIQAGFEYPADPDGERTPWMLFVRPGMSGRPAECDFVIDLETGTSGLVLREVVAVDADRIYLRAVRTGATAESAAPAEFLVSASYSVFVE